MAALRYRLALDLGTTSLGWAMARLNPSDQPCAVIKAGVRIFNDGRHPKDGSSLAVQRREARAMRRRRDRLLKRKSRMMSALLGHGFFPQDTAERKMLERLDPFALRARGLDHALSPAEFGRAMFHINQRRGFKSNRKTDKKDNDSGALKRAILQLRQAMEATACRTVGEWLNMRKQSGVSVRARYRAHALAREDGKIKTEMQYDLYIDRAMIESEFDILWARQSALNPDVFHEAARLDIKDCLLFQRPLKPVKPGRCTLLPDEERAPLALPSQQRFRIYQEVNNLRLLYDGLSEQTLTRAQRDLIVQALEKNGKRSFTQIRRLLGVNVEFNLEDSKRAELKGNATSAALARSEHFGARWHEFSLSTQDQIVRELLSEENETRLIAWLQAETGVDEARAEKIAAAGLAQGYGSLCAKALEKLLPELEREVITYDKAVLAAGFEHHSHISHAATGEILPELPYYGQYLARHVGFGTGISTDPDEKRFGKIANPTVHIGLNQVRKVVNALIDRYGHPSEVIVELARDLKQSQEQKREEQKRQAENQRNNERRREQIAGVRGISNEQVRLSDLHKVILWEELSADAAQRRCPYSGVQISVQMLLSSEVEIEHILPFSQSLDDSLNNKTVAMRQANRIKGNRSPWQARQDFEAMGWPSAAMLERAALMPRAKRYRFGEEAWTQWDKEGDGFLARALNDTRHLSRVAREYLSLVCPQNTRVIPGRLTAMLRAKFGLNGILGLDGEKNRNDHRHHAVDACVVAVTDRGLLQRFAQASASARSRQLDRLVESMPEPWPYYRAHVERAVRHIWVSHKPDHGFEGAMHNDTAYGLLGNGKVHVRKQVDGQRIREISSLKVVEISDAKACARHGTLPDGRPRPYKGYKGDSNHCMEIVRNDKGKWEGEVVSTFEAYQVARLQGPQRLSHRSLSLSGKPLVMRLMINDTVVLVHEEKKRVLRLAYMATAGTLAFAECHEANVDKRTRSKDLAYTFKTAGSLQKAHGRKVTVSCAGELRDPGFRD